MLEQKINKFKSVNETRSDNFVLCEDLSVRKSFSEVEPTNGNSLTNTVSFQESHLHKQTTVFDVAAYILHKMGGLSTIKLHKLVYYAQAWSLVWDDTPLFLEPVEAWINGPVIPKLFFLHKGLFKVDNKIMPYGNYRILSPEQKNTIDAVIEFYGDKSAQWLVELSHSEDPWKNARAGLQLTDKGKRIITHEAMAMYYGSL